MDLFDVPFAKLPVEGSRDRFPIHRVYCLGRNYADHVRELGGEPDRTPPVFFLKPADSVVPCGGDIAFPPRTENLHHEIELVVALDRGGRDIAADDALDHVFGYGVGIDLTRRDHQEAAKHSSGPWDTAKSFEQAAPMTPLHRVADVGHPAGGRIWLSVNDELRQDADLGQMLWPVPEAIAELSTYFTLAPGDLLFTGTPAGVGRLLPGDRASGGVAGLDELSIHLL